jgi:hypothetical protein
VVDAEGVSSATLLNQLASLDPQARCELAMTLRRLSESVAEVPDGGHTAHTPGLLAHLIDPVVTQRGTSTAKLAIGPRCLAKSYFKPIL